MTAQTAFADGAASAPPGPLAPGRAAGVEVAQSEPDVSKVAIGAGVLLAAVGIYFIVGTHYHAPSQKSSSAHK
jgi:hypothetical protein